MLLNGEIVTKQTFLSNSGESIIMAMKKIKRFAFIEQKEIKMNGVILSLVWYQGYIEYKTKGSIDRYQTIDNLPKQYKQNAINKFKTRKVLN